MKKQARVPLPGIDRLKKARELLGSTYLADALKCSPNTISVCFMGLRHGPTAQALDRIGNGLQIEAIQQLIDKTKIETRLEKTKHGN